MTIINFEDEKNAKDLTRFINVINGNNICSISGKNNLRRDLLVSDHSSSHLWHSDPMLSALFSDRLLFWKYPLAVLFVGKVLLIEILIKGFGVRKKIEHITSFINVIIFAISDQLWCNEGD